MSRAAYGAKSFNVTQVNSAYTSMPRLCLQDEPLLPDTLDWRGNDALSLLDFGANTVVGTHGPLGLTGFIDALTDGSGQVIIDEANLPSLPPIPLGSLGNLSLELRSAVICGLASLKSLDLLRPVDRHSLEAALTVGDLSVRLTAMLSMTPMPTTLPTTLSSTILPTAQPATVYISSSLPAAYRDISAAASTAIPTAIFEKITIELNATDFAARLVGLVGLSASLPTVGLLTNLGCLSKELLRHHSGLRGLNLSSSSETLTIVASGHIEVRVHASNPRATPYRPPVAP